MTAILMQTPRYICGGRLLLRLPRALLLLLLLVQPRS
jgi:hypothetical protein